MTKFLIIIITIALVLVVLFFLLGQYSKSMAAPELVEGKLKPCPKSPNCLCSQYPEDAEHAIAPIVIGNRDADELWQRAKSAITELGGTITQETNHYITATFTSKVFKFVDDVALLLDTDNNAIQMRSASRIGYGDMGVNNSRIEALRKAINHQE